MYNREIIITMESVKKVEEWLEIQKPENMCEETDLEAFKKSTEFVKTHVLRNGEKESVTFSDRINEKKGLLVLCIDDELMSYRAYFFRVIYAAITAKSNINIKELTEFNPTREMILQKKKDSGEEVPRGKKVADCASLINFWKDFDKEVEAANFIVLTSPSEEDFEPAIKRFQD